MLIQPTQTVIFTKRTSNHGIFVPGAGGLGNRFHRDVGVGRFIDKEGHRREMWILTKKVMEQVKLVFT